MPLLARFTNSPPSWTEWGGCCWMGLFFISFFFLSIPPPPVSPAWILWLFQLVWTTPYSGFKGSKHFQEPSKEQTHLYCAWVPKPITNSYCVPKLVAHHWGLEGEAVCCCGTQDDRACGLSLLPQEMSQCLQNLRAGGGGEKQRRSLQPSMI